MWLWGGFGVALSGFARPVETRHSRWILPRHEQFGLSFICRFDQANDERGWVSRHSAVGQTFAFRQPFDNQE
jgi:hypothetical protein